MDSNLPKFCYMAICKAVETWTPVGFEFVLRGTTQSNYEGDRVELAILGPRIRLVTPLRLTYTVGIQVIRKSTTNVYTQQEAVGAVAAALNNIPVYDGVTGLGCLVLQPDEADMFIEGLGAMSPAEHLDRSRITVIYEFQEA